MPPLYTAVDYPLVGHPAKKELFDILTLLSLTNADNLIENRKKILYTAAKIRTNSTPKELFLEALFPIEHNRRIVPDFNNKLSEIQEGFLNKKTTAYEIVGIIKDIAKKERIKFNGKEMGALWMKLSLLQTLENPPNPDGSLVSPHTDWSKTIEETSLLPTANTLKESFSIKKEIPSVQDFGKPPLKKVSFVESKPHLASFNTNWPEILLNMEPSLVPGLQTLLQANPENLDTKKLTEAFLWPAPLAEDIENRKLQNLLLHINSHPYGREARCHSTLRLWKNQGPTCISPTQTRKTPAPHEQKRIERLKSALDEVKTASQHPLRKWTKLAEAYNSVATLTHPLALTLLQETQTFLQTFKPEKVTNEEMLAGDGLWSVRNMLLRENQTSPFYKMVQSTCLKTQKELTLLTIKPDKFTTDKDRVDAISLIAYDLHRFKQKNPLENPEKRFTKSDLYWLKMEQDHYKNFPEKFQTIQKVIDRIENDTVKTDPSIPSQIQSQYLIKNIMEKMRKMNSHEKEINKILIHIENPGQLLEKFSLPPFTASTILQAFVKKRTPDSNNPVSHLLNAIWNGKKPDLKKLYGKTERTILHTITNHKQKYSGWGLQALIKAFKQENISRSPQDIQGNTPLHHSSITSTIELLKAGANPLVANHDGEYPTSTNFYSKKYIEEQIIKIKKLDKLAAIQESQP